MSFQENVEGNFALWTDFEMTYCYNACNITTITLLKPLSYW